MAFAICNCSQRRGRLPTIMPEASDGISLRHIHRLYKFDSLFRNKLIHVIEQMEIQLRAQISNYIALKYGPEGYIDVNNFADKKTSSGESVHAAILSNFRKECEHQKKVPL